MKFDMPFVHQASQVLCWEACAQMMWMWKFRKTPDDRYSRIVDQFKKVNSGMDWHSLSHNIYVPLGMQNKFNASPGDLRSVLKTSPALITLPFIPSRGGMSLGRGSGHAVIVLELNASTQNYVVVDPLTTYSSGKVMSRAYALKQFSRTVDSSLGSYIWYWDSGPY
ncbi:MAG: hypothetical protein DWQ47_06340 [Acidobacteria bacterium]|nr:MAG: hypothetical protein DWQ32_09890 [Acidobacteriota bacterium]REK01993.1 MAG: hypothetical protein DWQ38_06325 [Acidobacteriota bacterium]REK14950.1 MAG: hypothetical protein DWQ43_15580 [Acidobacteriota bacterium]REK45664.1 MAG: hypothetical protein DWQ47_06340 [Acidobacteriota bacterium]